MTPGARSATNDCIHSYRSENIVFATYFNAGLRVYDIEDPTNPTEVAYYIPECPPGQEAIQINDVFVDEDLNVFLTDRINGGVYILEPEESLAVEMTKQRL